VTSGVAVVAALLLVSMAAFQTALALGAPLGSHVLGGRQPGRLPGRLRTFSAIAGVILVGASLVVLAGGAVIGWPVGIEGLRSPSIWALAAFFALNTLGNVTSKSRVERTLFASMTAILAVLCAYVALGVRGT
jgi:hypothetical protein